MHTSKDYFEDIIDEARDKSIDLSKFEIVAFIGHEAERRLSRLLTRFTSKRSRPFNAAEAVCIEAASLHDFLKGKIIEKRAPSLAPIDVLIEKVERK